jgi:hypothetical protein
VQRDVRRPVDDRLRPCRSAGGVRQLT